MKINFKSLVLLSLTAISFNLLAEDHAIQIMLADIKANDKQRVISSPLAAGIGVNHNIDVSHGEKLKSFYSYGAALGQAISIEDREQVWNLNLNTKVGLAYRTGEQSTLGGGLKYSFDTNTLGNNHDVSIFGQARVNNRDSKHYTIFEVNKSVTNKEGWGVNVGAGINL